jgi:hypothetical protein
VLAQATPPSPTPARAPSPPPTSAAATAVPAAAPVDPAATGTPEPAVQRTVIEDDQNRIEELRVRGQVTSVTVQPRRGGAPAYRILPAEGGRDLSREGVPPGQRVWSVLSF